MHSKSKSREGGSKNDHKLSITQKKCYSSATKMRENCCDPFSYFMIALIFVYMDVVSGGRDCPMYINKHTLQLNRYRFGL
jgi:hypothetical protein